MGLLCLAIAFCDFFLGPKEKYQYLAPATVAFLWQLRTEFPVPGAWLVGFWGVGGSMV